MNIENGVEIITGLWLGGDARISFGMNPTRSLPKQLICECGGC